MATQRKDHDPGKDTRKGMSSPYPRQSTTQSSKNALIPPSEIKRPPNYLKATLSSGHPNPSSSTPPSPGTRIKQPSSSSSNTTAAATSAAASRSHNRHKPTLNRRRSLDKPPPPSTITPPPLQKSQTFASSHPSFAAGTVDRRRSLDKPPSPSRFHRSSLHNNTTNSNSVKPIKKSSSLPKLGQVRSLKLAPKDGGKSYSLYTGINSFKKITKDINPSTSSAAAPDSDHVSTTTVAAMTKAAPISTDSSPDMAAADDDHDHSTAAPTTEPQIGENQESLLVHSSDFEEVEDSDIDQLSTTESVPAALEEEAQVDLPEKKVQVHRHDDEDVKSFCDSSSTVLEDQNESMDVEIEGPGRDKERTLPVDEENNDQKEDRGKDENDNECPSPAKPEAGGEEKEREEEIGETENDIENENSSGKALEDQELEVNDQGNQPEPKLKSESEPEPEPKAKAESEPEPELQPEAKAEVQNAAGATRQGGQGKKESSPVYNDVIEQTANKLLEKRKNKVKALVGAFETVMSLQEHEA